MVLRHCRAPPRPHNGGPNRNYQNIRPQISLEQALSSMGALQEKLGSTAHSLRAEAQNINQQLEAQKMEINGQSDKIQEMVDEENELTRLITEVRASRSNEEKTLNMMTQRQKETLEQSLALEKHWARADSFLNSIEHWASGSRDYRDPNFKEQNGKNSGPFK
eukprot:983899_1